jgi:hypothetical protein
MADFTFCCPARPSLAAFGLQAGATFRRWNPHANSIQNKDWPMRICRIVLSLAISVGAYAAVQEAAIAQEYRGTLEQQLACTPDVFRLCGEQIPDTNRIVACLRQNTPQLSGPCRAVFESNASMSQQAAPKPDDRPVPYSDQ